VFGGHIQSGKTDEDTALSELEEETGISPDRTKLVFHGFIRKDDEEKAPGDKEFNMIYSYGLSDDEQVKIELQEEEVESAQWMPLSSLNKLVSESGEKWRPSSEELSASLNVLLGQRQNDVKE